MNEFYYISIEPNNDVDFWVRFHITTWCRFISISAFPSNEIINSLLNNAFSRDGFFIEEHPNVILCKQIILKEIKENGL